MYKQPEVHDTFAMEGFLLLQSKSCHDSKLNNANRKNFTFPKAMIFLSSIFTVKSYTAFKFYQTKKSKDCTTTFFLVK